MTAWPDLSVSEGDGLSSWAVSPFLATAEGSTRDGDCQPVIWYGGRINATDADPSRPFGVMTVDPLDCISSPTPEAGTDLAADGLVGDLWQPLSWASSYAANDVWQPVEETATSTAATIGGWWP